MNMLSRDSILEYPSATKDRQEDKLHISIKQYVPTNRPDPITYDAVTIIGAHGNGFPKVGSNSESKRSMTDGALGDIRAFLDRSILESAISKCQYSGHLDC